MDAEVEEDLEEDEEKGKKDFEEEAEEDRILRILDVTEIPTGPPPPFLTMIHWTLL